MSAFPKLKLTYFDLAGRGEPTRLAFHIGGVPFEDKRLSFPEFGSLKESLPYGTVPVLEVDGEVLAQSQGILRYAGRLAGLYPTDDPVSALYVDEVLAAMDELSDKISPSIRESDPEKRVALRKELADVTIPRYMKLIEARLAKHSQLPGLKTDKLFVHYLSLFAFMSWMKAGVLDHVPATITDGYPHCSAAFDRVKNHPKVQEWYTARERNAKPKLKLTYFDAPGRGEPIRLAFHIGGVAFEDERISFDELQERKPSLPFNQLPVLEVNGEVIAQSLSILRYAGTLSGLYPVNDPRLALRIDEVFGLIDELHNVWGPSFREKDPAKQAEMRKELAEVTIPKYLGSLDKRLGKWNHPYAVSTELTVADLAIHGLLAGLKSGRMTGVPTTIMEPFKNLVRVFDKVMAHPRVVDWYAARK